MKKILCRLSLHYFKTEYITLYGLKVPLKKKCKCGAIQHLFEDVIGQQKPTFLPIGYWKTVYDPYKKTKAL